MTVEDVVVVVVSVAAVVFVIWCPVLKPWFGFRKPKGHRGKWFS